MRTTPTPEIVEPRSESPSTAPTSPHAPQSDDEWDMADSEHPSVTPFSDHQTHSVPTTYEKGYFHAVSFFNNVRAALPPNMGGFTANSEIELPQGCRFNMNHCSLHLGIQPKNWLADKINDEAKADGKTPYVVSILEPFESKHTSQKLQKGSVHVVESKDNKPVSPEKINEGVQHLENAIKEGNKYIYVHCKSGAGRSATIVAAFLVKHAGLTPEAAGKYLHDQRRETVLLYDTKKGRDHYHLEALKRWNNEGGSKPLG